MPAPHDFGPQSAGQLSDPVVLQIGNSGDAPLEVSSVALAGESPSEFQLDPLSTPATVPIGGSLDVTVRANPSALGVRHAHLSVSSDDPLNPLATSGLSVTVTSTANDVNGDGSATVDDLLALTGELFDLDGMGVGDVSNDVPVSTAAADADGDGSVTAGDLAVLLGVFSLP